MNELLNFGLPEIYPNTILVVGVGGKSISAINYIESKGFQGIDLLVFNKRINEELLVKYKLIFILVDLSDLRSIYIASLLATKIKELAILTIGIITQSIQFEKTKRMDSLSEINSLERTLDSLIMISNDHTGFLDNETSFLAACDKNNYLSWLAIKTISDLAKGPGYISTDFADVYEATRSSGFAMITTGQASGKNRSINAVKKALTSSVNAIEHIRKAKNILLYISSGHEEATLAEIGDMMNYFQETTKCDNILWNCGLDPETMESIRITIIGTGLHEAPFLI